MVLSYIHVDGDFNPQRVTVARVHTGLHPQRVTVARVHTGLHPRRVHEEATTHKGSTKKQPCLSHHGHRPRRTCLTSGRSSRSRRSPCTYKLLGSLHNLVGGSQVTPSQSRRHHSPRSNKWCVDDELLALVLQMIASPTLNSLS